MLSDFRAWPVPWNAGTGLRHCQQRSEMPVSFPTTLLGGGSPLLQAVHSRSLSSRKLSASGPRYPVAWTAPWSSSQDSQSHPGWCLFHLKLLLLSFAGSSNCNNNNNHINISREEEQRCSPECGSFWYGFTFAGIFIAYFGRIIFTEFSVLHWSCLFFMKAWSQILSMRLGICRIL